MCRELCFGHNRDDRTYLRDLRSALRNDGRYFD